MLLLLFASLATLPAAAQTGAGSSTPAGRNIAPQLVRALAETGQPVKIWVFFTDKHIASAAERERALHELAATYNSRALQRRLVRGAPARRAGQLLDETDLPVAAEYIAAVAGTGARLHVVSRWLNAVSATASAEQVAQIAALPFVEWLQPVALTRRVDPAYQDQTQGRAGSDSGDGGRLDYGRSTNQLTQINVIGLHDLGFTAQGVIVGILDTGFRRTHQAFHTAGHELRVIAEWDFINNDPNAGPEPNDPPGQYSHGTLILGTLAAYLPGELVGGAYNASFILCKTEDVSGEYPAEEDYYVAGLEFIEARGGDMATSSLGYIDWYTQAQLDGRTAVTTRAVNIATENGMHCCTAAGNEGNDGNPGTSHLIAPADAFQVITCGAVNGSGAIASFSSDGPTADGRVKPELLARGVGTSTVSPSNDAGYTTASGTSLSTPLVAGAVACLIQAHPEWTVDDLRSRLFQSADYALANNGAFDPLYVRGYGVLNALAAAQDCNGNGVPDIVDLARGTSLDCNHNSVPDECDIAGGVSTDCNGNGVPDECERLTGDLNCDGAVNFGDINPFVLALSDPAGYAARYPSCPIVNADCSRDCFVDFDDIAPFVRALMP
ncbi:MAG: S8 family serine peptidase [Planctomycetota bacterium]